MKKIITYITAFILMASIIALIGFVTVKNTILNKEYVISYDLVLLVNDDGYNYYLEYD